MNGIMPATYINGTSYKKANGLVISRDNIFDWLFIFSNKYFVNQ